MGIISGTIELSKMTHVVMTKKGKEGKEIKGLFIPLELNHIVEKNERFYLNIVGFETPNSEYNTHGVKVSLAKEVREKMSKEDQNALPFIGSLNADKSSGSSAPTAAPSFEVGEEDDLQF